MAKEKRRKLSKRSRLKQNMLKKVVMPKIMEPVSNLPPSFRQRENVKVLDSSQFHQIPTCLHGPCLLFSDSKNNSWFGCAVFRSLKDCKFQVGVNRENTIADYEKLPPLITLPIDEYGRIKRSFSKLKQTNIELYWCRECTDYVEIPHRDPVEGPFSEFVAPSKLLNAIKNNKGEAYWFSHETLLILENALIKEEFDSVLCVGTPTVFESLDSTKFRRFLLDFDDRLALFYNSNEFARYSMLTNYFFHDESIKKLQEFFDTSKQLVIVCDPPFGVFIKALMDSLNRLREWFYQSKSDKNESNCKQILFLPLFVAKHVFRLNDNFSMVDFKVTYNNHKDFLVAEKSVVRIVTDLRNKNFELPPTLGYRFCSLCDRYVAKENKHCKICAACTSKDGTRYKHCQICTKCVKSTYVHCAECRSCHIPNRCPKK